jgi:crotonobetaine/carnitine-CoA ligase
LEVAVVDELDRRVKPGSVGEIVIRPTRPREIMDGYYGEPDKTLTTFRNLWLHTGDLGYMDDDGVLFYHGRAKDAVRRKGETISALQVEEAFIAHDDVLECAAVGVPSESLDEDLLAVIVLRPQAVVSAADLFAFAAEQLPGYMVPDFLRIIDTPLPRSASSKIEKYRLVEQGVTPDTFPRPRRSATATG